MLVQDDIKSLGWVLNENSGIWHKGKYMLKHVPSMGDRTRIWSETSNAGFSDTIFEGIIKSKAELMFILERLWMPNGPISYSLD